MDYSNLINENSRSFIKQQLFADKLRFLELLFSPDLQKVRRKVKSLKEDDSDEFLRLAVELENSRGYRIKNKTRSILDDIIFRLKYGKPGNFKAVKADVAIVLIAKNEASYIEEWLDHYIRVGVDQIYYLDNDSTDNTCEVLKSYIDSGFVTYIKYKGKKAQLSGYRYVTRKIRKKTKWVAFLDADEFLYVKEGTLKDFLKEYEQYPGVVVNWIAYGPCGHEKRPEGGVVENYTLTFADRNNEMNLRVKTIARADMIWDIRSPHYCIYKKDRLAVDENKNQLDGSNMLVPGQGRAITKKNSTNKIRINHYCTKSLEELEAKCKRGYAAGKDEPQYNKLLARLNYPLMEDRELADKCNK